MRFFRKLLGSKKPVTLKMDDAEAIFAMASASMLLEEKMSIKFANTGSLCIKIIHGSHFRNTIADCENFLKVSMDEFEFKYKILKDKFGYLWFVITAQDITLKYNSITNIAAAISSLGDIIEENGFALQILSVIFKFEFLEKDYSWADSSTTLEEHVKTNQHDSKSFQQNVSNSSTIELYIIYNYKTNKFYPLIPALRKNKDMSKEMKIHSILKNSIPTENDFSKWFPIKDIPF